MTKSNNSNKMWGGRFDSASSDIMLEINSSIDFDKNLYQYDILGSIAHAKMLAKQKIITDEESKKIISGLEQIKIEIESGKFQFKQELEDIHMNIESRLSEIIDDVAGKLHTARSRNDQVATDFKLYVRDASKEIHSLLSNLQKILIEKSEDNIQTIMPGFTHLQTAQPISFAHHLLAYFEMFERDRIRIEDAIDRLNQSPLGSAALAGTSFPIDREFTSKELDFESPCNNSLDGVSDRDFALDFAYNNSVIAMHLSRFAEEIVIWMSKGFDFIIISDDFCSGSSIMPQKKNPDAAELIRAKTGRIFASLNNLLVVLKGLPLTYSKDMQEDKEPIFDSYKSVKTCILAMIGILSNLEAKKENMLKMADADFSLATDLADFLVKDLNIPFRKCHHITGSLVKIAENKNCDLSDLSLEEMQKIEPKISDKIFDILKIENSVASRQSYGGTAFGEIKKQIEIAKNKIN
jgi:argininosuccinate lyase